MTIQDKFEKFHQENPRIFVLFVHYAKLLKKKGFTTYSAKAIFEQVRWHMSVRVKNGKPYKLNNNYTSRYARLLTETHPAFTDFFESRTLRS